MTDTNMNRMGADLQERAQQLKNAIQTDIPTTIGEMLVEGFGASFRIQRFNDDGSPAWPEVKRRQTGNRWYGFQRGTNYAVPPGARGYTASGRPRKYGTKGGKTNFSPRATTRKILYGSGSSNLQTSIYLHTASASQVIIASDQPHAAVHNEGLQAKIFGKTTFTMPKRQFMGTSKKLNNRAMKVIDTIVTRIIG